MEAYPDDPDVDLDLDDLDLDERRLVDDEQLLDRLRALLRAGFVRRWWLVLLDEDDRQLPAMPQLEGAPRSPDARAVRDVGTILRGLAQLAPQCAIVIERPGGRRPDPDDLAWAEAMRRAAPGTGVALRGVFLAHSSGVDALDPGPAPS